MPELCNKSWISSHDNTGGLANSTIYKMVSENLSHSSSSIVKDKIFLIGSFYSALPTRAAKLEHERPDRNGEFEKNSRRIALKEKISRKVSDHGTCLDKSIMRCRRSGRINREGLNLSLETHKMLMNIISEAINEWQCEHDMKKTISDQIYFASKYLHFHAPDYFFIYDSVIIKKLRKLRKGGHLIAIRNWTQELGAHSRNQYARHCVRMLETVNEFYTGEWSENWQPRLVDGHLYGYFDKGPELLMNALSGAHTGEE